MYVFDTNVFRTLGFYYLSRFPTIWTRLGDLAQGDELRSVREVRRELEGNCPSEHVFQWMNDHLSIFRKPNKQEEMVVSTILKKQQYQNLVKRKNLLKGLPVADPFVVAAAEVHDGIVVTQESLRPGGARIPTVCLEREIKCINLEMFLEHEDLKY